MTWIYKSLPIDESVLIDYVGFVYCITNVIDNRKYIGKKLLKFKRTKMVKGKKKRFLIDSDWKKYWGSNKHLIEDVRELSEDNFIREILVLCKSKGECNYFESKYQFDLKVLESDDYYNEWIVSKIHKSHIKKVDFSSREDIIKVTS
jgi:hypothetical protein